MTKLSEGFVKVAEVAEIAAGTMKVVEVAGEQAMIANIDGKFFAIGNICTHVGGPLAEGTLEGNLVTCPLHGSKFDVTTGKNLTPPAGSPEPTYEVKIEDSAILLKKRG